MEGNHAGAGSPAEQTLLATATDQETGAAFLLYLRQSAEIAIRSRTVPVGLWKKREEPGFMLANGFALLESERDADGNYIGGAGMDGMYTRTPHRFQPILDRNGQPRAFRDVTEPYVLVADHQGGKRFSAFVGTKARCLRMAADRKQMEDFFNRRLTDEPGLHFTNQKHVWSWAEPARKEQPPMDMKSSAKNIRLTPLDDLFKTEAERQDDALERVQRIPIEQLYPFQNHPFQVRDDESMKITVESVKLVGVLSPAIARPRPEGGYELISGHRRKRACELAGRKTMPVIVRDLDDDAATILMVDSNLQRETILPSERAFAFKMKLEAMRRQAGRPSKENGGQVGPHFEKGKSRDILADQTGESAKQISRFVRLTCLVPELLQMVDDKKIAFNPAVELSFLKEDEQRHLLDAMESEQSTPSLSQAQRMKKASQDGKLSNDAIDITMSEEPDQTQKISISKEQVKQYFPKSYTPKQMQDTILHLLEQWQRKRERDREMER